MGASPLRLAAGLLTGVTLVLAAAGPGIRGCSVATLVAEFDDVREARLAVRAADGHRRRLRWVGRGITAGATA